MSPLQKAYRPTAEARRKRGEFQAKATAELRVSRASAVQ